MFHFQNNIPLSSPPQIKCFISKTEGNIPLFKNFSQPS